jgi:hypothetical protein
MLDTSINEVASSHVPLHTEGPRSKRFLTWIQRTWLLFLRGPHGTSPDAIDSPLFELFGARCLTWKAWELLIVVVPNPKEKASMIRVGKMEASPSSFSRSLCQVSPSAFQPGFRRANRSIILDMLFLLPVLPSLVIGDLINPINPSSVSSHQM